VPGRGLPARAGPCSTPNVKVEVDRDACEANAVCAGLVPEVFEVDDDERLNILVADVPPGLADAVRHAVMSCPKAALRLEE
jgi:ferredoxin